VSTEAAKKFRAKVRKLKREIKNLENEKNRAENERARILRNINLSARTRATSRFGVFAGRERRLREQRARRQINRPARSPDRLATAEQNRGESIQSGPSVARRAGRIFGGGLGRLRRRLQRTTTQRPRQTQEAQEPLRLAGGTINSGRGPPQPPRGGTPVADESEDYGWWTWVIIIIAILVAVSFLFTNPLNFISFLGPFWLVIIAVILLVIVISFSARGQNVNEFFRRIFETIRNFITGHWRLLLLIIAGVLLFYYALGPLLTSGTGTIIGALAATAWFRWVVAGLLIALGVYLFFKKGKDKDRPYPYRKFGILIIILAFLFGWLFEAVFNLVSGTFVDLSGFRWIISGALILWGLYLLLFKEKLRGRKIERHWFVINNLRNYFLVCSSIFFFCFV